MPILQVNTYFTGESGVNPRLVRIVSNDSLSTITSANYLNPIVSQGYYIYPTDLIAVSYSSGSDWFKPNIDSSGNITLVNTTGNVTVSGSVTPGDLISFVNSSTIEDVGYKILYGTSSTFAGGGTNFSFTVNGATNDSVSICVMKNQTNSAYITSIGTITNQISVTFSSDPGAATRVNYITFVPNT